MSETTETHAAEARASWTEHDERDGFGCLTVADSGIPFVTDEPGKRCVCICGRRWEIREVAGFVVWQPLGGEPR